ncbi:DUF2460 domain-containing protein [Oceanomicrobium pacificus]|uniref:TIGR02217 family protein n=1 Tax=Oceanomicrobium pacificus TaxID=2692916 RepID=A0A6B0TYG7_9RHOB|nr:DUF2460 domain-containing protein [Oceanomicrobium pacificus]MXU66322.1 TIGR02217 family protein [Oceanomicrobium pacificus]
MGFHETRFPTALSFGAAGGPERRTDIVTLANGHEERNSPWAHARRRYDAGMGLRSLDDLAEVLAFFEARRGQLHGFRWKDWADFKSCAPSANPDHRDCEIGIGDGVTRDWPLVKTYRSGAAVTARPVSKPVAGTVLVGIGGDAVEAGLVYTLDPADGVLRFEDAPASGAPITAGFEFDVPVRFDTDRIMASVEAFAAGEIPNIPVVEVRV